MSISLSCAKHDTTLPCNPIFGKKIFLYSTVTIDIRNFELVRTTSTLGVQLYKSEKCASIEIDPVKGLLGIGKSGDDKILKYSIADSSRFILPTMPTTIVEIFVISQSSEEMEIQ